MLLSMEMAALRGFSTASEATDFTQNIATDAETGSSSRSSSEADCKAVSSSPQVKAVLTGDGSCRQEEDVEAYSERRSSEFSTGDGSHQQHHRESTVMAMAVSCLHSFAQSNWTGPAVSVQVWDLSPSAVLSSQDPQLLMESIHSSSLSDGESVYSSVVNPFLSSLARVILTKCSGKMEHLQLLPWWTLRYINSHQQISEARSPQLLSLAHSSMDKVSQCQAVLSGQRSSAIQFHSECAYISSTYYEYGAAKEHISRAKELSGLHINMTGALGKRTRFQEKFLAQSILDVKRQEDEADQGVSETSPTPTPRASLPKDYHLDDDTVLDQINLAEPDQYQSPDSSGEEQAVISGVCTDFQKNNPVHKLTEEESLAFTSCISTQPKFWSVEVTALCIRTKSEKGRSRCVERAMMQTQAIVDHFEDESCSVCERLKVFYCCQVPPRWAVQKSSAGSLIDSGCISSASLLYEKSELWEDAVICYEKLGQHGKAEEIVRRESEKKETPSSYCLLGDISNEHQYYDQAWESSGHRSSRAMRSKASSHLRRKEFQQCVDCFEKSSKINTMQLGVWFSLGCAYFASEGYEGAARAFQRCVGLEPDNAEAWNNLSTAYIRLQMKTKAFRTSQEASKCNYEHWQIWENFSVVSTDIGDFAEAIKAYHRLMDSRENFKDVQILQISVRAVVENSTDSQGAQAGSLTPTSKELFGRVSARHSSDAEIWWQYAVSYGGGRSSDPDDNKKASQFSSKAHRCEIQASGWEKDPVLFREVIRRAITMGEVSISCSEKSNPTEALQMLSSSRLSLRSSASKAKQIHTDVASGEVHADLQDAVATSEQLITKSQNSSGRLRNQSQ